MSIAESSNLTRLLRLLTDVASAAEAQQLRASMREDEKLKRQHDKLVAVMMEPFSLGNSMLHLDQVEPEIIAAFVDGGLETPDQAAFEQQCWNSESLLREVATAWRFENDPNSGEPLSLLEPVRSSPVGEVGLDPQSGDPKDSHVASLRDPVPVIEPFSLHQHQHQHQPQNHRHTRHSHLAVMLALASAAAVAAVLFGAWKWSEREETTVPVELNPESVVQQDQAPGKSPEQEVVQNDSGDARSEDPQNFLTPKPEKQLPEVMPKEEVIVDVPDGRPVVPDLGPGKPLDPGILQPSPKPFLNLVAWMDWSDVRGVAATRDAVQKKWRGIQLPGRYADGDPIPWFQVATLPASQLKGEDATGATWTAGANTSFKISQRAQSPRDGVVCDLTSGRLAIEHLGQGRTLFLRVNEQEYPFVVGEADTTLVLQKNGREMVLGVFRGSVNYEGGEINRRSWRTLGMAGKVATLRPEKYDAWYNQKFSEEMPATLRKTLNSAPDFLAQVIDVSRQGTLLEQTIGAQAILSLNAADNQPPDDAALRKMMGSEQEVVRATLIKWLVRQCRENPRYGMMMAKRLCRLQSVPEDQAKSFEEWFGTVARAGDYNQRVLDQLMDSLTIQSKPVVRQAAKFFLEEFLQTSLPYNPVKPGANINRVLKEVERQVTEKQRRSGR